MTRHLPIPLAIIIAAAVFLWSTSRSPSHQHTPDPAPRAEAAPADRLVQAALGPGTHAQAQALYAAGHNHYKLGNTAAAAHAFITLAAVAPGTLLEVEALRMQAQIKMVQGQDPSLILPIQQHALAVLDAIPDPHASGKEAAIISLAGTMGAIAEGAGDFDAATDIADRVLKLKLVHEGAKINALLRAASAQLALGNNARARAYLRSYLDDFPDDGWEDGRKIQALRQLEVASGMQWNAQTNREIEFCKRIISDPRFANDPSRFDMAVHLATCLLAQHQYDQLHALISPILAEAAAQVQQAAAQGDLYKQRLLKEHAEGALRSAYAHGLAATGQNKAAMQQISILTADPDFGGYTNVRPANFGIDETHLPD